MGAQGAIGIDLGGTKLEILALGPSGREIWRRRVPTPSGDYEATIRAIAELVREAEQRAGPCTIGIGTPGSVTASGTLKNANSTCLNGRPFPRDVEKALGRPVRIANDANCLALSEATDGAGAGAEVVFAIILGTGVGGGVAVRGSILTGPNGLAGEWGHNPLPWATPRDPSLPCYCGRSGCIETVLSGPGLARDHEAVFGRRLAAEEIARRERIGDPECARTIERFEERLARGLAHVIHVLDPDVIVAGGGLSRIERIYREVPRLWAKHIFSAGSAEPVRTRFAASAHGDSSGVRGAAWLGRMRSSGGPCAS
ncbi:MAG: fructokinase [Planctomycetota bacterium]